MALDAADVHRWFGDYLETYAACMRGEREVSALLRHYGVPMILTSDNGVIVLMTDDEAGALMQSQADALRALGYHHSDVLASEATVLNSTSALYRVSLSRRNIDGAEITSPTITYLVTDDAGGLRIAVLAAHGQ